MATSENVKKMFWFIPCPSLSDGTFEDWPSLKYVGTFILTLTRWYFVLATLGLIVTWVQIADSGIVPAGLGVITGFILSWAISVMLPTVLVVATIDVVKVLLRIEKNTRQD